MMEDEITRKERVHTVELNKYFERMLEENIKNENENNYEKGINWLSKIL